MMGWVVIFAVPGPDNWQQSFAEQKAIHRETVIQDSKVRIAESSLKVK